ncbi:MAG: 1,4-alpha-glucan branching protein GlgB [Dehalococcoidia bacterium]|nr:1,4-alpha-glucan branching protein GlgB [Dehalococcoidia bacterium]
MGRGAARGPHAHRAPVGGGGVVTQRVLSDYDTHLLAEGTHLRAYERLGAHPCERAGRPGSTFAVWAPNARAVSVIGDFNGWDPAATPLDLRTEAGTWEGFVPGVGPGERYKFSVLAADGHTRFEKADPYAFYAELRPASASIVWDIEGYEWLDGEWMGGRERHNSLGAPMAIYEVHLGSWARAPDEGNRWLTYREIGPRLARYAKEMHYTHVELMPVAEHALDESWGYQTLGYFAPTSRFGEPQEFMELVDTLHQAGIGVIVDWVPAHFPKDAHGLGLFDGTHLYEHADPRIGEHPDWGTYVFNYGRREVSNFLLANALFWLDRYHIDGLRVDAVASMLYRDYSREAGEWLPNHLGGREHLEAIAFLRRLNEVVFEHFPGAMTFAEESTAWPMVSRPTSMGGLGFGLKWNMGWMHDTLRFMTRDPIHRGHHLNDLSFGLLYAYHENFVLPYSHDEVVHLKRSMVAKMPGDEWQQFANLRALYGYMYGHPGKKLLFMGSDFGQRAEWNALASLDWHELQRVPPRGLQHWVQDLNRFYTEQPALYEQDYTPEGFEWIDCSDVDNVVVSFVRKAIEVGREVLVVSNFTPVPREHYRIGAPGAGRWHVALNSDATVYGGSGYSTPTEYKAEPQPQHGRTHSLSLTLPPLATLVLVPAEDGAPVT